MRRAEACENARAPTSRSIPPVVKLEFRRKTTTRRKRKAAGGSTRTACYRTQAVVAWHRKNSQAQSEKEKKKKDRKCKIVFAVCSLEQDKPNQQQKTCADSRKAGERSRSFPGCVFCAGFLFLWVGFLLMRPRDMGANIRNEKKDGRRYVSNSPAVNN